MKLSIIAIAIVLAGCASPDYQQYAKSTEASSVARSKALAEIAKSGDTAAVAATMALAMGAGQSQLQAPQPNQILQWASILVPGLVQAYGIKQNASVAINASNNAMQTSAATTGAFVGIAGKIQAPTVTLPQASIYNTTTNTMSNSVGVLGAGQYSYDSTHPATVVTQPTPIVITQPSTVVVGP